MTTTRTGPRTRLILTALIGAQFMISMDATIVNVALPSIKEQLGFAQADLGWVVNAYALPFGGLLLLGARLGDALGTKKVFVAGTVLFSLASLWCGLADSAAALVAARALQGVGAATMSPVAMTMLVAAFDGRARHRALGWWGAMSGLAGGLGMLVGGLLSTASWRWNFLVAVPVGVLVLVLSRHLDQHRVPRVGRPDVLGAVLSTTGLLLVAYAVVGTERDGWAAWSTSGLLGVALLLLAGFVLWQRRAADPLVPLRIFGNRNVSAGNAVIALTGAIGQITYFMLTLYLQQVLGYGPLASGAVFLPISAVLLLVSTRTAWLIKLVGLRGTLAFGLGVTAVGSLWMSTVPAEGDYLTDIAGPSVVWAFGWGIAQASSFIAGAQGVGADLAGVASGLIATTYRLGGAIGLAVVVTAAAVRTESGGGSVDALTGGHQLAFLVAAGFAAVAAALCALLQPQSPARTGD
ncbi:MAG: MFS transporter [Saccharothrix sp.]|nr:MFS transporter [Saccharothrix sp.]